jgi:hypothetical protein
MYIYIYDSIYFKIIITYHINLIIPFKKESSPINLPDFSFRIDSVPINNMEDDDSVGYEERGSNVSRRSTLLDNENYSVQGLESIDSRGSDSEQTTRDIGTVSDNSDGRSRVVSTWENDLNLLETSKRRQSWLVSFNYLFFKIYSFFFSCFFN